jgi:hypothetical protein
MKDRIYSSADPSHELVYKDVSLRFDRKVAGRRAGVVERAGN